MNEQPAAAVRAACLQPVTPSRSTVEKLRLLCHGAVCASILEYHTFENERLLDAGMLTCVEA